MIKIIENGQGVRLNFNDIEVFNHTSVIPFIKSIKGDIVYGIKNGYISAKIDKVGEYQMTDYRVLCGGLHSGNIMFFGYDNKSVKLHIVEEDDALKIEFSQNEKFPIMLTFLSNAFESIFIDNNDIKGATYTNIQKTKLPPLKRTKNNIKNNASFNENISLISSRGYRLDISSLGLITFDMTKKMTYSIMFEHCPKCIYVYKDNTKINEEIEKLYTSLDKNKK